jgi:hypothetical protein
MEANNWLETLMREEDNQSLKGADDQAKENTLITAMKAVRLDTYGLPDGVNFFSLFDLR